MAQPEWRVYDYIMVKRRFQSSVNIAKTRSFPGPDIGSDHELVMMTFRFPLKKIYKKGIINKFDINRLMTLWKQRSSKQYSAVKLRH
jgi:hypothetical protein